MIDLWFIHFTWAQVDFAIQVITGIGWTSVVLLFLASIWVVHTYVKSKEGFGSYDAWGKTILYDEGYRENNEAVKMVVFLVTLLVYFAFIAVILWMIRSLY